MACTSEGYKLKTYKHITKERVRVTCPEQIIGKFSDSSLELKKTILMGENVTKLFFSACVCVEAINGKRQLWGKPGHMVQIQIWRKTGI